MKLIIKLLAVLLVVIVVYSAGYLLLNRQFGGTINASDKKRFEISPQWNGEVFENQVTTTMDINLSTLPGLLKKQFSNREGRAPLNVLPLHDFKLVGFMRLADQNVLIDPMCGEDASPVGPVRTERFTKNTLEIIDSLPPIAAIFITHDHYDHLDYNSFLKLREKTDHFYVPLGVKRHLLRWGIPPPQVTELDWWESVRFSGIKATFVPSRHFSGRGLFDRGKSLWGGWSFATENANIYWSGDGGYGSHFKEIGSKLGPFDLAFLECGQYNKLWHAIHMYPEESVQAAKDVKAKVAVPIHWGAFTLAFHHWRDPAERFKLAAKEEGQKIAMPEIGRILTLPLDQKNPYWWEAYE